MPKDMLLEIKDLEISLLVESNMVNIIDNVSFDLKFGEVIAIVGESGCGKTVTSQAIARLLPRELKILSGKILFYSKADERVLDVSKLDPKGKTIHYIRGDQIGMIFQEPMSSFSPVYTIGNQICEVIRLHQKVSKKKARNISIELLDTVGIPNPVAAVDQYPHEFSGGMRQRAMIARAISCNPSLLIADEPTTALDVTIQAQILVLLQELQKEFGMAIIFITHDLGVVAQISHRVFIMYMGKIVEEGSVHDIFYNPKHPYTENLIHAIPKLGNLSERRRLVPIRGNVPSIFDELHGCAFHPRCNYFMPDKCEVHFPKCAHLTSNHSVWCYLYK